MQERSVMGAHPRRGEDVGPEFFAGDGPVGRGFDGNGGLGGCPSASFGNLAQKLGIKPKDLGKLGETADDSCVVCDIHE